MDPSVIAIGNINQSMCHAGSGSTLELATSHSTWSSGTGCFRWPVSLTGQQILKINCQGLRAALLPSEWVEEFKEEVDPRVHQRKQRKMKNRGHCFSPFKLDWARIKGVTVVNITVIC